jgi:hypothetical protein
MATGSEEVAAGSNKPKCRDMMVKATGSCCLPLPAALVLALVMGMCSWLFMGEACRFVRSEECSVVYLPDMFVCDYSYTTYIPTPGTSVHNAKTETDTSLSTVLTKFPVASGLTVLVYPLALFLFVSLSFMVNVYAQKKLDFDGGEGAEKKRKLLLEGCYATVPFLLILMTDQLASLVVGGLAGLILTMLGMVVLLLVLLRVYRKYDIDTSVLKAVGKAPRLHRSRRASRALT